MAIDEWTNEVHVGDALETLQDMPSESVHLIVTSPPYWNIKDYEMEEQIGYGDEVEEYVESLRSVIRESHRVLKPGCRMVFNIGDVYVSSDDETPYHVVPLNSLVQSKVYESPQFIPLGSIIWRKVSNTDSSGGASVIGSYGRPRNGYVSFDYEYINILKKSGGTPTPGDIEQDEISSEEWKELFTGHWNIPGERQVDHPAPFPVEIPRRLIKMFSFSGDVVLDPFIGSGTTAVAADQLGRDWIGIDLNEEYAEMTMDRLRDETNNPEYFDQSTDGVTDL